MQLTDGEIVTQAKIRRLANSIPASYKLYKDGSTYYAECGVAGGSDYDDDDADVVLQNVFDNVTPGARIHFGASTFLCGAILTTTVPMILTGEGPNASILKLDANVNTKLLEVAIGDSIQIYDLGFDGNKANQGVSNVVIARIYADDSIVENCIFHDAANAALVFDGAERCAALGNYCYDNTAEGMAICGTSTAAKNIKLVNNWCLNNGTEGILASNAAGNGVSDILIQGNHCGNNTLKGIQISNGTDNVTITDNFCWANTYGISISGTAGVRDILDVTIANNYLYHNTDTAGIGLGRVERFSITGNKCFTHTGTNCRGIEINGCTQGTIADNIIKTFTESGIILRDSAGPFYCTYIDVHDNLCDGGTYGVYESGSSDYNWIHHNMLLNNSTAALVLVGANTKHFNPQGQLIEHHTANDTLTIVESGTLHTNLGASGAIVLTLPQNANKGTCFEFAVMTTQELRIDPGAAGAIYINGAKQTDDKYVWADDEAETVKLMCDGNGDWIAIGAVGTWGVEA